MPNQIAQRRPTTQHRSPAAESTAAAAQLGNAQAAAVPQPSQLRHAQFRFKGLAILLLALLATLTTRSAAALRTSELPRCKMAAKRCIALSLWIPKKTAKSRRAWLREQLTTANEMLKPLKYGVQVTAIHDLPVGVTNVATTTQRTALGERGQQTPLRWFVADRLVDDTDPGRTRGGVTWRSGRDVWIIVAAKTSYWVLAHELGHVLGLDHDDATLSVMNKASSPSRTAAIARAGGLRYEPSKHKSMLETLKNMVKQRRISMVRP